MKSFKKVALAAAVACVAAGNAFAAVDFDPADTNAPPTFAKELVVAGTTAVSGADLDAQGNAGFGVVSGQTRYVRYQLTNAEFANAVAAADLNFGGVNAANVTIVQGGGAGDDFVVFQVQADINVLQSASVTFDVGTGTVGGIVLTSATDSATISYSLYEDAPSAAAGGSSGRLNTGNNAAVTLAGVATGLDFSATPTTTTVDVAATTGAYSKFLAGGAGTSAVIAQIGTVTYKGKTGVLTPAGAQVALSDLVAAGTKLVLKTSDVITATGAVVSINGANCGTAAVDTGVISTDKKSVVITTDTTAFTAAAVCMTIDAGNSVAIANQDFTIESDVTAAAGSTLGDSAAVDAGEFERNGTVLKSAVGNAAVSLSGSVHLTNTSSSAATFSTSCLTYSGRENGLSGSLPAGTARRFGLFATSGDALGCPSNTVAVELTLAVPSGSVIGSVVRWNPTTSQFVFEPMTGNN